LKSDWENLAEQLKSLGKVNPKIEGRIVDVANSQVPNKNIPESEFSGTADKPKVYEGNVTVDINNISLLENAVVKGNLIITGAVKDELSFSNVQVEGNLDLSETDAKKINFDGITVTGETIL